MQQISIVYICLGLNLPTRLLTARISVAADVELSVVLKLRAFFPPNMSELTAACQKLQQTPSTALKSVSPHSDTRRGPSARLKLPVNVKQLLSCLKIFLDGSFRGTEAVSVWSCSVFPNAPRSLQDSVSCSLPLCLSVSCLFGISECLRGAFRQSRSVLTKGSCSWNVNETKHKQDSPEPSPVVLEVHFDHKCVQTHQDSMRLLHPQTSSLLTSILHFSSFSLKQLISLISLKLF